jgi:uncharacterized membrane-anchored protein YitT (DUF2179 family)
MCIINKKEKWKMNEMNFLINCANVTIVFCIVAAVTTLVLAILATVKLKKQQKQEN